MRVADSRCVRQRHKDERPGTHRVLRRGGECQTTGNKRFTQGRQRSRKRTPGGSTHVTTNTGVSKGSAAECEFPNKTTQYNSAFLRARPGGGAWSCDRTGSKTPGGAGNTHKTDTRTSQTNLKTNP